LLLIFEEQFPTDDTDQEELTESRALVPGLVLAAPDSDESFDAPIPDDTFVIDLPDEGWRSDSSESRFIQFSFNPRYFDMDIPNTTLYRAEAEVILRRRPGFFYVKDRPEFEHPEENAERFNPLRKVYVHGDERTAAEDMAYVWFNVWKFPVDWRFYVTAGAFYAERSWEEGVPIE